MRSRTLFSLFIGIALVVAIIARRSNTNADDLTAAGRGLRWLMHYPKAFADPGILWAVDQINRTYCGSADINAFVSDRFRPFDSLPIERGYRRLIDPEQTIPIDNRTIQDRGTQHDALLLPALYCDIVPLMSSTTVEMRDIDSASGYDLTHKFIALLFARQNGCAIPGGVDAPLGQAASRMVAEQTANHFDDLFAERTALLTYGGFRNRIDPLWIDELRHAQLPSGAWMNPQFFAEPEDPHTTALAVWTLAQYANGCPH